MSKNINPLDKFSGKVMFPKKVEAVNKLLAKSPIPKEILS